MLQLRRDGDFPFLLWKDTAPQHFESTYGEYPQASLLSLLHGYMALGLSPWLKEACVHVFMSSCQETSILLRVRPSAFRTFL